MQSWLNGRLIMISGIVFSCGDFTWMKLMSTPSISVVNCGIAFQFRLALAPVVIGCPVAGELLDHCRLHALRPIGDEIRRRPARHGDMPLKVGDFFAGHVDPEWPCR